MRTLSQATLQGMFTTLAVLLTASGSAHAFGGSPLTDQLLRQGPYGSGLAALQLEDTTRPTPPNGTFPGSPTRPLPTTVWYPAADRNADQQAGAASARTLTGFPLVIFGHGITSEAAAGSFVAAHLATHGYVVAGPDFPLSKGTAPGGPTARDVVNQAGDVLFIISELQDPALQAGFPVASRINFDRTGVLGYSLGGATMALAGSDPSIDAVATLAPAICPLIQAGVPTNIDKPLFILQGTTDNIVHDFNNAVPFFQASGEPRFLATIENGSHTGFLTQAPAIESAFPTTPLDDVVCNGLLPLLGSDPIAQACKLCNPFPLPTGPQLSAARQHELTRAGVLAFFNAYLRCSPLALTYLKLAYERENSEIDVTSVARIGDLVKCLAH
jgi:alpha-beta hydrolase superfamily lysophospholipase